MQGEQAALSEGRCTLLSLGERKGACERRACWLGVAEGCNHPRGQSQHPVLKPWLAGGALAGRHGISTLQRWVRGLGLHRWTWPGGGGALQAHAQAASCPPRLIKPKFTPDTCSLLQQQCRGRPGQPGGLTAAAGLGSITDTPVPQLGAAGGPRRRQGAANGRVSVGRHHFNNSEAGR